MTTQKPPPGKADAALFGVPAGELAILRDLAQARTRWLPKISLNADIAQSQA